MSANNIPNLEPRFLEPAGWRWHHLKNSAGKRLRFGTAYPESRIPSAVVVMLPGRAECAEKYFETAQDLLKRNLSVWILEWQGQGLSDRFIPSKPERNHSGPFTNHVEDLHEFILEYVKHACVHPDVGRIPMVMLAQSMGANIGLRYLHAHPGMFEAAALSAPLLGITAVNEIPAGTLVARVLSLVAGKSYAFGQHDWIEGSDPEDKVMLSTDPVRNTILNRWFLENPNLRVGGVTFGWVWNALQSCLFLQNPEVLKTIKTHCLIAVAGKEQLVDNTPIRAAAAALPYAKLLELPDSGHEIMMERDETRNQFLEAFMQLIKEAVLDRPETLKTF
jgi:lysophospholipase